MDTVLHVEHAPLVEEGPSVAERIAAKLSPRTFTYGDLRAYYINIGRSTPGAEPLTQSDKNCLSVLKKWQELLGKTDESPVHVDLDPNADFNELADAFDTHLEKAGNGARDRANKKSMLAKWAATWSEFLTHKGAPAFEEYHEAVQHYLNIYLSRHEGVDLVTLCRKAGLGRDYLGACIREAYKTILTKKVASGVQKLEEILGTPRGALTRFYFGGSKKVAETDLGKRFKTEHSTQVLKRARELGPYRLNTFPESLFEEWVGYFRHQTARFPALERGQGWRICKSTMPRSDRVKLAAIDGKHSPSAATYSTFLSSLFGYACIFYEIDRESNDLSLSHLLNIEFLKAYIEFMDFRAGRVTSTAIQSLQIVGSLIHPKRGYLTQLPETFAQRHPERIPEKDWPKFCRDLHRQIWDVIKKLKASGAGRRSREPDQPIANVLRLQHPITYLLDLIDRVDTYIERESYWLKPIRLLTLERFSMMLKFIVYQPLRIKMFSIMETGQGSKDNFYKRADGCWAIRFKPEDFKNEKGAAQKPYDVAFPAAMSPHIERYLTEVRSLFRHADSPYVFPGSRDNARMEQRDLGTMFQRNVGFFVDEGEPAFGPHAVRHIVATDYIRNNLNGFQVAADVLHDKLETVLKAYAHLKAEDGHRHYQKYMEVVIAEREAA